MSPKPLTPRERDLLQRVAADGERERELVSKLLEGADLSLDDANELRNAVGAQIDVGDDGAITAEGIEFDNLIDRVAALTDMSAKEPPAAE